MPTAKTELGAATLNGEVYAAVPREELIDQADPRALGDVAGVEQLVDPVVDLLLSRAAIGEMLDEVLVRDVVATAALLALSLSTFLERQSGSTIPTERRVTVPFWDVTLCRYSRTPATSAYFQSGGERCNAVTVFLNSIAAWAGGVCASSCALDVVQTVTPLHWDSHHTAVLRFWPVTVL